MKAAFSLFCTVFLAMMPQWSLASNGIGPAGHLGYHDFMVTLFILIVILLICRGMVCWYLKINKAISLLAQIRDSLQSFSRAGVDQAAGGEQQCSSCGSAGVYYDVYNKLFCPRCNKYVDA